MKIDLVLTACTIDDHYLNLVPLAHKIWKTRFNLELVVILIVPLPNTPMPSQLESIKSSVKPFVCPSNMHPAFVSQTIRVLYPALFHNQNILTTDADIFPISLGYFVDTIADINQSTSPNVFVTYRDKYIVNHMYAICYNIASSSVWQDVFNIKSEQDITATLEAWYDPVYDGKKNCTGWFTDQLMLFQYVNEWNKTTSNPLVILQDKTTGFNRLDKRSKQHILANCDQVVSGIMAYTDFHVIAPYKRYAKLIHLICDRICSSDVC